MNTQEMRNNLCSIGFNYSLLLEMTDSEVEQTFCSTSFEELQNAMDYYAKKYNYQEVD